MRFDTPVYFRLTKSEYNAESGNYDDKITAETLRYASVTDTGTETLQLVYGELKKGSKTIRLQSHFGKPFDRIRIGNTVYRVDMSRKLRTKHIFVVSEV